MGEGEGHHWDVSIPSFFSHSSSNLGLNDRAAAKREGGAGAEEEETRVVALKLRGIGR